MNKIATSIAAIALAAGLGSGLAACGSSGGGPATPENATQILQANGYTVSSALTNSLQNGIGTDDMMITSSVAGENGSDSVQAVLVFDSPADEALGLAAEQSTFAGTGIALSTNGDVLTATGPLTAWAAAGS